MFKNLIIFLHRPRTNLPMLIGEHIWQLVFKLHVIVVSSPCTQSCSNVCNFIVVVASVGDGFSKLQVPYFGREFRKLVVNNPEWVALGMREDVALAVCLCFKLVDGVD